MALAVLAASVAVVPVASPAASAPSGGGTVLAVPPTVTDVICLTECVGLREVAVGGTVQISGRNLASAARVTFAGESARITVDVTPTTDKSIVATVPEGAVTGKVRVRDASGALAVTSPEPIAIAAPGATTKAAAGAPLQLSDATTSPRKAYYFGMQAPRLTYVISGGEAVNDLRIDVVRSDGTVVRSMFRRQVPINSSQTVKWDGKASDGKTAPNGSYSFVVKSMAGETASLSRKAKKKSIRTTGAADPMSFKMYGYIFPVRGAHTYGDGIGAPRGGHTHQGLDVLAECSLPLVAARGGIVHYNSYQAGGAGNYIVISPLKGTGGKSHVYMHMAARSPLQVGQTVRTGQRIGVVGTTGSSSACHLHFEEWSAPGWYEGGTFLDPEPAMRRWDRYS